MAKRFLIMKSGEELEVTGEQGKYWLSGERKTRKLNRNILRMEEREAPEKDVPEDAPKAAKKPAGKKKKKAEE